MHEWNFSFIQISLGTLHRAKTQLKIMQNKSLNLYLIDTSYMPVLAKRKYPEILYFFINNAVLIWLEKRFYKVFAIRLVHVFRMFRPLLTCSCLSQRPRSATAVTSDAYKTLFSLSYECIVDISFLFYL